MVDKLIGKKEELKQIKLERNQSVVLYWNEKNKELGWFKNGNEKLDWKYEGEIKNGIPNGHGILTTPVGYKYIGDHKNGLPHGFGTWTTLNGTKYVGKLKNGLPNGQGVFFFFFLTDNKGTRYEGEHKNGKPNGKWYLDKFNRREVYWRV